MQEIVILIKNKSGSLGVFCWIILFISQIMPVSVAAITIPETHCIANCGDAGATQSTPSYTPPRPTPEEIRRQREEKDLNEAAQDSDDKGVEAYERGDYAGAVRYFKEALDYSPNDGNIRHNLQRAQQRLRDAEAARQLKSTQYHSTTAAPLNKEPASAEARQGFDTGGKPAGTLNDSAVNAGAGGGRDPIVPASKRTPRITALEHERDEVKKSIAALEAERMTLNPKTDAVKISEIKQRESQAENKIHYLNMSISADLEHPSPTTEVAPGGASQTEKH